MISQTIILDSYDNLASTLDKISKIKEGKLLLVLPTKENVIDNKLDLVLIKRHCLSKDIALALVVRNNNVQELARAENIQVFSTIRQSQKFEWDTTLPKSSIDFEDDHTNENSKISDMKEYFASKKHDDDQQTPNARFQTPIFIVGIIAVLAIVALILPKADITLHSISELQEISLIIQANTSTSEVGLSGNIPAQIFEIVVEGEETLDASGSISIPAKSAIGSILITSLTSEDVLIPSGTKIWTSLDNTATFFIVEEVNIDASIQRTVEVDIQSHNPGVAGNLPANSLVIIENPYGLIVSVNNPNATAGGTEQSTIAPSLADYDLVQEILLSSLRDSALSELGNFYPANEYVVLNNPISTTILEQVYTPETTEPANQLNLSMQIEFEYYLVQMDDINSLGIALLDRSLPNGFRSADKTFEIVNLSQPELDDGNSISWEIKATRTIISEPNNNNTFVDLRGLRAKNAKSILTDQYQLSQEPIISIFPNWWPWLPFIHFRINIISN